MAALEEEAAAVAPAAPEARGAMVDSAGAAVGAGSLRPVTMEPPVRAECLAVMVSPTTAAPPDLVVEAQARLSAGRCSLEAVRSRSILSPLPTTPRLATSRRPAFTEDKAKAAESSSIQASPEASPP